MTIKRFFDKVLNKIDWRIIFPMNAKRRRKKLINTDFTVIANNCWAGRIYDYFDLPKQSPTVGSYFYAEDYVKFCSDLKGYLSKDLELISAAESKHKDDMFAKGEQDVIVGRLGDVEIIFLHYADKQVILDKWQRRLKRINWDNIILKFSYQNGCTDEIVKQFYAIKGYPKIFLSGEKISGCPDVTLYKRSDGKETIDEMENFDRYINIVKIINSKLKENVK